MGYFNPASTGLHKLAAGLAASDVARAQQFYWPQMVQNQACLWRDRLANSGTFSSLHSFHHTFDLFQHQQSMNVQTFHILSNICVLLHI